MEYDYIISLCSSIKKDYTKNINSILKDLNVTLSDFAFLNILYHENNLTQDNLAKKVQYNNATVTRSLIRLEKRGFIKRNQNINDKREKIVQLTPIGREVTQDVIHKLEEYDQHTLRDFDDEEIENCKRFLKKYLKKL